MLLLGIDLCDTDELGNEFVLLFIIYYYILCSYYYTICALSI